MFYSPTRSYKRYNAKLRKMADPEKITSMVSQQVALVGSQRLYEKINNNFTGVRFDAIFAKVKLDNSIFNIWFHFCLPGAL